MDKNEVKKAAQDALMRGLQVVLSNLPDDTIDAIKIKSEAVEQFRRVEKLFGYEPRSWSPYV